MEEDIKIIEDLVKYWEDLIKTTEISSPFYTWIEDEKIEQRMSALKNLIARNKELETIVKTYNAIPNDYMSNDVKIVIADREYFNNGILKENLISKSKIKEKIKELNEDMLNENESIEQFYKLKFCYEVLQELLEES